MRRVLAALLGLLLLAGCAGGGASTLVPPDRVSRIDVDNPELREKKQQLGIEPCPRTSAEASPVNDLPDLALQCLGGGREVNLRHVQGPAVVSLWASWCTQCVHELPLFERLDEESGDELTVLGVDYQDAQPGGALLLLEETGADYFQLADPGGELADHYRVLGLPALLLVDAEGEVTFTQQRIDSYRTLLDLVEDRAGVALGAG